MHFDFQLTRRPHNNFQVDFGGVIASRNISNIFLGLNYYYFNNILTRASLNFSTGSFYKSVQAMARLDFPSLGRFYLEPEATYNSWNFLEAGDIIIQKSNATILTRIDRRVGLNIGVPVGKQFKASMYAHYISNNDEYIDNPVLISTDTLDALKLSGGRYGISLSTNTLNHKQYASTGKAYQFSVDWFNLIEETKPGNTSTLYKTVVPE